MQYKIVKQRRAWWPVKFPVVADDGAVGEAGFEARFILMEEDAWDAMLRDISDMADKGASTSRATVVADIMLRVMEDWRGVALDDGSVDGQSLPFGRDNLIVLFNQPNVIDATVAACRDCRKAKPAIRAGN